MIKNAVNITPLFLSTALVASSVQAEPENPFFLDNAADEIRQITTNDQEIQAACPQLQTVRLQDIPFANIPKTDDTRSIYFVGDIIQPHLQNGERLQDIESFRFDLKQANRLNDFFVHINSLGGSTETALPMAYDIVSTQGTVVTYATNYAASMAFSLLISGSEDFRYVDSDTYLMTHEVTTLDVNGDMIHASDLEIGTQKTDLDAANAELKEFIEYNSVTGIEPYCVSALIQPKTDVQILPDDAVRLGLVDYSINWFEKKATVRVLTP